MDVTALVMAGGKGTRMELREEKPMVKVGGKPMIQHVIDALKRAGKVDEIVVAVSKHTPITAEAVERFSVKVLETPGEDYVSDMQYAVKKLKLNTVLTISADLPLVTDEIIDEAIECYERCGKPALAVTVPAETREKLGLELNYVLQGAGRRLVPAGINMIDGRLIDEAELDEEVLIIDREEVAMNVNTSKDLEIVERFFRAREV